MPSRRVLLRGAIAGAVAVGVTAASGCGIQLEQDAHIPFITRRPMPDEGALLTAYRDVSQLAAEAVRTAGPHGAAISARHTRQRAVLEQVLRDGGVPDDVLARALATPTASTAPTGSTGVAPSPAASSSASVGGATPEATAGRPEDLATAELALVAPERLRRLADSGPARGLLIALSVHAGATGLGLGGAPAWPADAGGLLLDEVAARPVLTAMAGLAYVTELAAARTPAGSRAPLVELVARVRARERRIRAIAGQGLVVPPYGFGSPAAITDAGAGHSAVRAALVDVVDVALRSIAALAPGSTALEPLVRTAVEALVDATAYGHPMPTFPGMTD